LACGGFGIELKRRCWIFIFEIGLDAVFQLKYCRNQLLGIELIPSSIKEAKAAIWIAF
jgi:hypothetical protein